jgi:hypothetical protein
LLYESEAWEGGKKEENGFLAAEIRFLGAVKDLPKKNE